MFAIRSAGRPVQPTQTGDQTATAPGDTRRRAHGANGCADRPLGEGVNRSAAGAPPESTPTHRPRACAYGGARCPAGPPQRREAVSPPEVRGGTQVSLRGRRRPSAPGARYATGARTQASPQSWRSQYERLFIFVSLNMNICSSKPGLNFLNKVQVAQN